MELKVKFLIVCAVIALVHSSPMPQEIDAEAIAEVETTTAAHPSRPSRPSRPTRPQRPLINAISSAIQTINSVFTTAGNIAQSAFGTVTNTGYNAAQSAADSANYYINSAADTFQSGLSTATNIVTTPWALLPSAAPAVIATDENGAQIPIESLAANPDEPAARRISSTVREVTVPRNIAA